MREEATAAPFLSYHAAIAGLANMATAISAAEKSLLIASSFDLARASDE
jgi:hypothetical protein